MTIVMAHSVPAQHSQNQVDFKKKSVTRTPRYRHDGGGGSTNNGWTAGQGADERVNSNEVLLQCSALMNVRADSHLAIFNLTQVATTAKEADELINKRIQNFRENLRNLGVSANDVYVDMV